jgi:hypothetical protein
MAKAQNNVEEAQSTTPLPEYNPVSSIVQHKVAVPTITKRSSMTRATHKNWRRTMRLLKSLGKTV